MKKISKLIIVTASAAIVSLSNMSQSWGQTTVLTLDCATPAPTGSTSTALTNADNVAEFLNSAAGLSNAENKINCTAKSGDVYKGKGSGGGDIPQQCLKVGKASGGGGFTFTIPNTYDEIDEIDITCYGWKTTSSISVNSGEAQTFTTAQVETKKTFTLSSSSRTISIAVTTSAVCITEIVLKKKSSSLQNSDLTLVDAPVSLSFDLYNNSSAQTINYLTSSTGLVTVSASDYVTTSVDADNKTITVTPKAKTSTSQTITVSQAADDSYKAGSVTFSISITDSTPGSTVTLYDDNTKLTEVSPGSGVDLPSRNALNGYTFEGWSADNISEETSTAPTIIPAGPYYPLESITLYPVYSKTIGGGGTTNRTASVTISNYASANNWSNGNQYTSVTLDDNITATASGSTNTGKYYSNNNSWRFYSSETGKLVLSAANGAELTSATITFSNSTLSYNTDNISSGTEVPISGSPAEFAAGGTTYITAISVKYTISGSGTTYYWSSPVAAAVEVPEITVAENPFLFSTTATITCATEGAVIKYSYDGENWSDYSAALTITETNTIYAKGVKDNNESYVVSVTATKNLAEPAVTVSGDLIVDLAGGTNVNAGKLTAAVTYNNNPVDGATVTWSSSNDAIATISTEGDVTIKAKGEVTFTATYAGNSDYAEATDNKAITVIDSYDSGQVNNPYTVAQARSAIDENTGKTNVYVAGIISQVSSYNTTNKSITYWISDDGTTSNHLQVYQGKGINGSDFSALTDVKVGASVVVKGNLNKYNSTYEFDSGNELVSYIAPSPIISAEAVDIDCDAEGGSIEYTLINDVEGGSMSAATTSSWLSLDDNYTSPIAFICGANTMPVARTATVTLTYTYNTNETVTKDVIITQAAYVATSVSTGEWVLTDLADLTEDDVFVIVGDNGDTYALSSNGTSNAPTAYEVTIKENRIDETETPVTDALKFKISGNATDGYVFYPQGSTTTFIYTTDTNNGVRVGKPNSNTTEIHNFTITNGYLTAGFTTRRYLGIYNSQDWRTYTSTTTNIANQTFSFYKLTMDLTLSIDEANITSTSAMVSWNNGGKASYTVELAYDEEFNSIVSSYIVSGNSYIFKDLTPGTTYYARVDGSTPISFTTLANNAVSINRSAVLFEGRYWTTFYKSNQSYKLENGVQAFTMHSDNKLYLLGENGRVIPAGTAVIIIADKASITLTECTSSISDNDNILEGSDTGVVVPDGKVCYVLGIENSAMGFYKYSGTSTPAEKAYILENE